MFLNTLGKSRYKVIIADKAGKILSYEGYNLMEFKEHLWLIVIAVWVISEQHSLVTPIYDAVI